MTKNFLAGLCLNFTSKDSKDGFVSDLKEVRWQVSITINQSSIKSCVEFSMDTFTMKKLLFNLGYTPN